MFILAVILASTLQREQARIAELDRQRRNLLTLVEHEVPGPLRELATDLRGMAGIDAEHADRLTKHAEQLVFLSNDLASLGELEAGALRLHKRPTNVVEMVHELRAGAVPKRHVLVTVPVTPVRVNADADRLRQALDAMFREVSATADTVTVDCRSDKGTISISIASATMTVPATAAKLVRGMIRRVHGSRPAPHRPPPDLADPAGGAGGDQDDGASSSGAPSHPLLGDPVRGRDGTRAGGHCLVRGAARSGGPRPDGVLR